MSTAHEHTSHVRDGHERGCGRWAIRAVRGGLHARGGLAGQTVGEAGARGGVHGRARTFAPAHALALWTGTGRERVGGRSSVGAHWRCAQRAGHGARRTGPCVSSIGSIVHTPSASLMQGGRFSCDVLSCSSCRGVTNSIVVAFASDFFLRGASAQFFFSRFRDQTPRKLG